MAADLKASAYLVDGDDLAVDGVELTHDGAGLWSGLTENIGVSAFPGADGGSVDGGVFPPYTNSTLYTVRGSTPEDTWARLEALRRRCKPGRTVTLTRLMPDPEGADANAAHTATARRQGTRPVWLSKRVATLDIDWLISGGPWCGDAVAIADAAGAHTVLGDLRTYRMTITLLAGAARTVTNTTPGNGHAFDFLAAVPTGGVLVDVEACTAVAITSGADMSGSLRWAKKYPMRLDAGPNTLTVSAGSASISYQPAYE